MAIKRYTANADNTITNAYDSNLLTRVTGANAGLADSLEVFNIYKQASTSSIEQSRVLVKFPISEIASDRSSSLISESGSTSFYLKMYNVKHAQTLPRNYTIQIFAASQSWDEGQGVDLDEHTDIGASNWVTASATGPTFWAVTGASAHTHSAGTNVPVLSYTANFPVGNEDLELDVTDMVEKWMKGTYPIQNNYGFLIMMSQSMRGPIGQTDEGAEETLYTKRFSARSSEFFFKRPVVEARWDSRIKDDRGNFYYSSSLARESENKNILYLYNVVRGRLRNIPGIHTAAKVAPILVSLYSSSHGSGGPTGSKLTLFDSAVNATGGYVSTGIYSCSLCITSSKSLPLTKIHDVWHTGGINAGDTGIQYTTGTIVPIVENAELYAPSTQHVLSITNLRAKYSNSETARFRLFCRKKNWNPTIYSKATADVVGDIIESASYSIYRTVDDLNVVPYGTGSDFHTFLSYDKSGSYFDFDMSMLDAGYQYAIRLVFYNDHVSAWREQPYTFKFRVEEVK